MKLSSGESECPWEQQRTEARVGEEWRQNFFSYWEETHNWDAARMNHPWERVFPPMSEGGLSLTNTQGTIAGPHHTGQFLWTLYESSFLLGLRTGRVLAMVLVARLHELWKEQNGGTAFILFQCDLLVVFNVINCQAQQIKSPRDPNGNFFLEIISIYLTTSFHPLRALHLKTWQRKVWVIVADHR